MTLYLIWELLSFIFISIRINKKQSTIFLAIIIGVLMGIRSVDIGVSDTRGVYYTMFDTLIYCSLNEALSSTLSFNYLMTIYVWVMAKVFNSFRLFVMISSTIPLIGVTWFFLKYSKNPIYSLVMFFSLYYFYLSFLIKQMLALTFVLMAYDKMIKKDLKGYLLYVTIATLFHQTMIVLYPIYLICKFFKFNKKSIIILAGAGLIGLFGSNYLLEFLYQINILKFESYIKNGVYKIGGSLNFSIFFYPALTFLCYMLDLKNGKIDKDINKQMLVLMLIGSVLNMWSVVVTEFYRISIDFLMICCVLFTNNLIDYKGKNKIIIKYSFLLFFYLYAFRTAYNTNCLPYHSFLID